MQASQSRFEKVEVYVPDAHERYIILSDRQNVLFINTAAHVSNTELRRISEIPVPSRSNQKSEKLGENNEKGRRPCPSLQK
jgi:hypothetical protein